MYKYKNSPIVCGDRHTFFRTDDGYFFVGENDCYQGGNISNGEKNVLKPRKFEFPEKILQIECGATFSVIRSESGIYTCGRNLNGDLLPKDDENLYVRRVFREPQRINFNERVVWMWCGRYAVFLLTKSDLYAYGCNDTGELGIGTIDTTNKINKVIHPKKNVKIKKISGGNVSSALLYDDGTVCFTGDRYGSKFSLLKNNNQFVIDVCARQSSSGIFVLTDREVLIYTGYFQLMSKKLVNNGCKIGVTYFTHYCFFTDGMFGIHEKSNSLSLSAMDLIWEKNIKDEKIKILKGVEMVDVFSTRYSYFFVSSSGDVYSVGYIENSGVGKCDPKNLCGEEREVVVPTKIGIKVLMQNIDETTEEFRKLMLINKKVDVKIFFFGYVDNK